MDLNDPQNITTMPLKNGVVVADGAMPVRLKVATRPSQSSPNRVRVGLFVPVGDRAACVAEFRIEMQ